MNEWEKQRLRKLGMNDVGIWEIEQYMKQELNNNL